jgi:hypothetical protein
VQRRKAAQHASNAATTNKGAEALESAEQHRRTRLIEEKRAELQREAQQIRELRWRADHRRRNICYVEVYGETGGQLLVNWPEQLQVVWAAWDDSDWDFVRTWLQKYAYEITSNGADESVHSDFKKLMTQFTQVDPLYRAIMAVALPQIQESPGILQSALTKNLQAQFKTDEIRYALYFAAESGQISRVKKGRSYQLHRIAE